MSKPVDIVHDLAPNFWHGSLEVGAAAVQLIPIALPGVMKGVQIKASFANTDELYVGKAEVTAASADVSDGLELSAGEGVFIPIQDVTKIWIIASAAAQEVYWMAV